MESNCDFHTSLLCPAVDSFDISAFQTVDVKDSCSDACVVPPAEVLASLSLDELKAIAHAVSAGAKDSGNQKTVDMKELLPGVAILPPLVAPTHTGGAKNTKAFGTVAQEEQQVLEIIATKLADHRMGESRCPIPPTCSNEVTLEDALSLDRFGEGASCDLKESCRDALAAVLSKYSVSPQKIEK